MYDVVGTGLALPNGKIVSPDLYLEYYRSGKYQERYKMQRMKMLTVTIS